MKLVTRHPAELATTYVIARKAPEGRGLGGLGAGEGGFDEGGLLYVVELG
jgi:hypothetical protein